MKLSKERKVAAMAELNRALLEVREFGPRNAGCGICGNVHVVLEPPTGSSKYPGYCERYRRYEDVLRLLRILVGTWPDRHPGRNGRVYPVGGGRAYHIEGGGYWRNPRRLQLLDYLIERTGSYGHD